MTTFAQFRDGVGGRTCLNMLELDLSGLNSWSGFTDKALAHRDHFGSNHELFIEHARTRYSTASTGESALFLAILHAMDYTWLADELLEKEKSSFLGKMRDTFGDYAIAVAACFARDDAETAAHRRRNSQRAPAN